MQRFFSTKPTQRFIICTAVISALIGHGSARAATMVWNGGGTDTNWSTGGNWSGGAAPINATPIPGTTEGTGPSTIDSVQYGSATGGASNVDSSWYIDTLQFNSTAGSYALSGSTITFRPTNASTHDGRFFLNNASGKEQVINNNLEILPAYKADPPPQNFTNGSGIHVGNSGNIIINGNVFMNGISAMRITGGIGTVTINGVISGGGGDAIAINNGATAIFNNTNTYTKNTTIWHGTLKLGADALYTQGAPLVAGSLGMSSSAVTMGHSGSAGAKLLTTNAITVGRDINFVRNNGNIAYVIGGESSHISNFTGTIRTGADASAVNALEVTAAAGGRVNINSILQRTNATGTLTDGTVTKTGAGIVALTGTTNTYSGQTNVNAGTFLVNGTLGVASSSVIVASGASLGGTGTINRSVTLNSGAFLKAGDMSVAGVSSVGKLTINSDLLLNTGTLLAFDIGSGGNDWVDVNGLLTLRGTLQVTNTGGFGNGSYKLFEYDTLSYAAGDVILGNVNYSLSINSVEKAVYLNVVPEPSVAMLGGLAAVGLVLRRKRRPARI